MLSSSRIEATIPAVDLDRAKDFYGAALGLTPSEEVPGVLLRYRTDAGTPFTIYRTEHAGRAGHTVAQWHVDDIEAEVRDLQAKGVVFEVYDLPGLEWDGDIASVPGMGKIAWFRDSENNVLGIDQES